MKILIVEDEQGIANFLQQGLEEEGYEVYEVNASLDRTSKGIQQTLHDTIMRKSVGQNKTKITNNLPYTFGRRVIINFDNKITLLTSITIRLFSNN
jgi:hypothetical protein